MVTQQVGYILKKTTGTFTDTEVINITKPTVVESVAKINGTIKGNIGNGNTQFVVKTAVGGTPANMAEESNITVTSIHYEYTSLSSFEEQS